MFKLTKIDPKLIAETIKTIQIFDRNVLNKYIEFSDNKSSNKKNFMKKQSIFIGENINEGDEDEKEKKEKRKKKIRKKKKKNMMMKKVNLVKIKIKIKKVENSYKKSEKNEKEDKNDENKKNINTII